MDDAESKAAQLSELTREPPTVIVRDEPSGAKSVFVHLPGVAASHGQALYNELSQIPDAEWIQSKFMQHLTPRLQRWHSMAGMPYRFSGTKYESVAYSPRLIAFQQWLLEMLTRELPAEVTAGVPLHLERINSVLINKYRHHRDSISPHADNEFGSMPTIVSVSFGAPRKFVVKRMTESQRQKECVGKKRPFVPAPGLQREKLEFCLDHGDVLIMAGSAQEFWYHEVPKEHEVGMVDRMCVLPDRRRLMQMQSTAVRYNLTFRPFGSVVQ